MMVFLMTVLGVFILFIILIFSGIINNQDDINLE